MGLMINGKNLRVERDVLKTLETPEPTRTHVPVSHDRMASLITNTARINGYEIRREDYGINPSGSQMFGVLRFARNGDVTGQTRALGFRNSHDKTIAVGMTVGVNVLVCDNMCFGGDVTIHRKHTSGIDIEMLVDDAFMNLDVKFDHLETSLEGMREIHVTMDAAKITAVDAARIGAINSSDIIPVLDEFRNPAHDEFGYENKWCLYNSFTEVIKKYSPARYDRAQQGLTSLFEIGTGESIAEEISA